MARRSALVLALLLGWALGASAQSPMPVVRQGQTTHYRLALQIGPQETMYSKADAAKMHPASGEIMAGGTMSGGSMPMAAGGGTAMSTRHLEVHVTSRATGKVVTDAACRITVTNDTTKKTETIPVAMMYGIKEGPADWHYGNNVSMSPGPYTVAVMVNGEKTVFHVRIPKA